MDQIGLQLFSMRHFTSDDFEGSMEKAEAMGYGGVEFAGYFGLDAAELKAALHRLRLEAAGTHIGLELLEMDLDGVIEYALEAGIPYIICPALPTENHESRQAWLRTADTFERIGREVDAAGLKFGYHTHAYCFDEFDGEFGIDILFANTSPEYVKLQYDVGNSEMTGKVDSLAFMRKYAARMELLHMKDYAGVGREEAVPVGDGLVDWKSIIDEGRKLGVKWYTVEYEGDMDTVMDSIRRSADYLKRYIR